MSNNLLPGAGADYLIPLTRKPLFGLAVFLTTALVVATATGANIG
jgi:hypothetical protein